MPSPRFAFASLLPAALLAPGPGEYATEVATLDARLERMVATGEALHRLHGAWAERLAAAAPPNPCDDVVAGSLVARSRVFGGAYRDAVQDASAQLARVDIIIAAPTAKPLLNSDDLDKARYAHALVERHRRMVLEDIAWHAQHVEPLAEGCAVELAPMPGVAYDGPSAARSDTATAVYVPFPGVLCPAGTPLESGVQVVTGVGCYGIAGCGCAPEPLDPGAVLGTPSEAR